MHVIFYLKLINKTCVSILMESAYLFNHNITFIIFVLLQNIDTIHTMFYVL